MPNARVIGTGSYLPEKILTNDDISKMVDTSHEWIVSRSGIEQRHIAEEGQTTADLAEQAALKAIETAGISAKDIDLILVATTTPDFTFPSVASMMQHRLGCNQIPAMDLQAVCSGFVYAMEVADKYIISGSAKRVLVIGAETYSRILDWTDRSTCVLFGDGAAAVILEASEEEGIISTHLHTDGRHRELLYTSHGPSMQTDAGNKPLLHMQGNDVFKVAVNKLGEIVEETLEANNMQKSDIDWLVPHQANIRIIKATAKKLKMSMDQVVVTVEKHGNTSAASIPLAFDEAVRDGRIKRGQTVLMEAFGGGFVWGSVLLKY